MRCHTLSRAGPASPDPDVPLQRLPENQRNKLGGERARAENLDWLTEARPRWYRSSDWAERGFCSECGSQMFYRMDDRPLISIAPGAFDSSEMLSVAGQIFRSSHPTWGPVGGEIADLDNG